MKNYSMGRLGGFTLIELLVVVLIIGILSAIALPQYQKAVDKSRMAELFTMTKALKDAQEVYFMANGKYASSFDELDITVPAGGTLTSNTDGASDGNQKMTYPNGNVFEVNSRAAAGVRAENFKSLDNLVVVHLDHSSKPGVIECVSRSSGRFENLCKSYGGTRTGNFSNGGVYQIKL